MESRSSIRTVQPVRVPGLICAFTEVDRVVSFQPLFSAVVVMSSKCADHVGRAVSVISSSNSVVSIFVPPVQ